MTRKITTNFWHGSSVAIDWYKKEKRKQKKKQKAKNTIVCPCCPRNRKETLFVSS